MLASWQKLRGARVVAWDQTMMPLCCDAVEADGSGQRCEGGTREKRGGGRVYRAATYDREMSL